MLELKRADCNISVAISAIGIEFFVNGVAVV